MLSYSEVMLAIGENEVKFESNGKNEIFFVDGAETVLSLLQKEALTAASAHFIESFRIKTEVDVYVSKRSVLHLIGNKDRALAWHIPPSFDRENSIVCVFIDPESDLKSNITSLAHEFIHAWQVERGDLHGMTWAGYDCEQIPYQYLPWEYEAHTHMQSVAEYFFRDDLPTSVELRNITSATAKYTEELKNAVNATRVKKSFKTVAKLAAGVGLAALMGGL